MAQLTARRSARISLNKLGEYVCATPLRRRGIIQEQKRPKPYIVAQYSAAAAAISRFLVHGDRDALVSEGRRLRTLEEATDWKDQRNARCSEAIDAFLSSSFDLGDMPAELGASDAEKLLVAGVRISVRPELILVDPDNDSAIGGVKLHFSKTSPLHREAGEYAATLIHEFLRSLVSGSEPVRKHCLVFDVFSGSTFAAPRSYRRRMSNIQAACEEIARGWSAA